MRHVFKHVFKHKFSISILPCVCLCVLALNHSLEAADTTTQHPTITRTDTPNNCTRQYFSVHSASMQRDIPVCVVLPPEYAQHPDKHYPILYTLHGGDTPFDTYSEMASLRTQLATQPMIVAMFDAGALSFYLDASGDGSVKRSVIARKPKKNKRTSDQALARKLSAWNALPERMTCLYRRFFFEEYVPALDSFYRINPAQRGITGFSMGGFGAIHYTLTQPDFFNSASSISSSLYVTRQHFEKSKGVRRYFEPILGTFDLSAGSANTAYSDVLLFERIEDYINKKTPLPPIALYIGDQETYLQKTSAYMCQGLVAAGYACSLTEKKGDHNWKLWSQAAPEMIDFHWQHFQKNSDNK